jgi:hypothetical protein
VPAGVVQVIAVGEGTVTPVHALPPIVTVVPAANPAPEIVALVPPVDGPLFGLMAMVGAAPLYVKAPVAVMVELSGFVMTTGTAPAAPAGVVQVIVVAFVTAAFVQAFAPIFTVALVWKFVPAIVIPVPPAGGPLLGVTLVMVGAEP